MRVRLTSRISTSSVISARGLSLVSTSSRMTSITGCVARTVIVLFVLFGMMTGGIVTPVVVRVIAVSICGELGRIGVRQRNRERDLPLVLQPVRRRVLRDDDRPLVEHGVEQPVRRQQRVERLLERARQVDRHRAIAEAGVVDDVDAGRVADEREDVAQARLLEADVDAARATPDSAAASADDLPRLLAKLDDRRLRARRLDAVANDSFELHDLVEPPGVLPGSNSTVRRYSSSAASSWSLASSCARVVEVHARRIQHRALERDAVFGACRDRPARPAGNT